MSFLYDRDYNVTGTVQTTFDFKPSYGTSVNFSADLSSYTTVDNYLYTMPKGMNHLQMTVQMPFENRKEAEDAGEPKEDPMGMMGGLGGGGIGM